MAAAAILLTPDDDSDRIANAIDRDFPTLKPSTDRAWTRAVAVRVVDCVLSLNRRYDGFVVPRLDAFERAFPGVTEIRQLRALVDRYESPAAFVRNALNYNDPARAVVLDGVIEFLLRNVVTSTSEQELPQLERWAGDAHPMDYARVGVKGFGRAGFQYLRMLFGANTTKPDVHIRRYVTFVLERDVSDVLALSLLERATARTSRSLRDLDTSVWERSARGNIAASALGVCG